MRHNAIHIAARFNHASIVSLVLDAITDQKFIKLLYLGTRDTADARDQRMAYLLDLYLNSHDKGVCMLMWTVVCSFAWCAPLLLLSCKYFYFSCPWQ